MTAPAGRIRAFDWLRGLAVVVMIQCHALSLLRPELRQTELAHRLGWLDGLVAPSFIFAAGFSLALVQVRGAAAGSRLKRVVKTARRLGEVLVVALLGTFMWFWYPILHNGGARWFLRVDILLCIFLALIIALPLMAALARRPMVLAWVSLALAVLTFALSPFGELVHGPLSLLANQHPGEFLPDAASVFPLLPWAGYVYLGASAGATAASGELDRLLRWIVGLGVLGLLFWKAVPFVAHIYPERGAWLPSNHGNRIVVVCCLVLWLLFIENRIGEAWLRKPLVGWSSAGLAVALGVANAYAENSVVTTLLCGAIAVALMSLASHARDTWKQSAPVRFVEVFGTSSLAGYFFHEMLLYYDNYPFLRVSFYRLWGDRSSWPKYWLLTAALIACTFVVVKGMDAVYRVYDRRVRALMGEGRLEAAASAAIAHNASAKPSD